MERYKSVAKNWERGKAGKGEGCASEKTPKFSAQDDCPTLAVAFHSLLWFFCTAASTDGATDGWHH